MLSIILWCFSAALFITTIVVVAVVILENRNPVRSLAWVTVLLVVPVVGLFLYFIFGRDIKSKRAALSKNLKRKLRKQERAMKLDIARLPFSEESLGIIRMADSVCGATLHFNNSATVYDSGQDKFNDLFEDIAAAEQYIFVQYYIIENDKTGQRLAELLAQKARDGVKVYLIYDPVGSVLTGKKFFKEMKDAGVNIKPFIPVRFPGFGTRINWRNHRKQCVIDGKIAYVGGMNVAERYITGGNTFDSWRDIHMRVTGNAVMGVQRSFITDWSFMSDSVDELPEAEFKIEPLKRIKKDDEDANLMMQLVRSGPTSQWYNIELLYLKAIGSARHRVYLETPYFLPTEGLLNALQTASLSGVDVRILIPVRSDSAVLTYASSSYITECLRAGIKVYLYKPGMLHSKMLIIDDELVSIGSTNFDFRSFEHNFELTMLVFSKSFNTRMIEVFRHGLAKSERVNAAVWAQRSRWRRMKESFMRLLAPIL